MLRTNRREFLTKDVVLNVVLAQAIQVAQRRFDNLLLNRDRAGNRGQRFVYIEHHRMRELAKILKPSLRDSCLPGRYRNSHYEEKHG